MARNTCETEPPPDNALSRQERKETVTMSLIDWSDPEEMLGLLVEYVADEASASHGDAGRAHFLNELSRGLAATVEQASESIDRIELALREIYDAQPREFATDPVMAHVEACVEELHRIATVNLRGALEGES